MTRICLFYLVTLPLATAFLLPLGRMTQQAMPRPSESVTTRRPTALAGSFYEEQRKKKEQAIYEAQQAWAARFQELLIIQGQELCVAAYEGFLRTGSKGAVVVLGDQEPGPQGYPVNFRTLEELLAEPDEQLSPEEKEEIASTLLQYSPEDELPVILDFMGQKGLNVVRPQYSPKYIFENVRKK